MRRHPSSTAASLISLIAVFFVLNLLLVVTYNVRRLGETLEERKGIIVFLEPDIGEQRRQELSDIFQRFDEIQEVRWVSREQALRELERDLGGMDIEDILGDNPLPETFVLEVREETRDAETLNSLAREMTAYEGVNDVLYGREWVETLDRGLGTMRRITLFVGVLAVIAVSFVLGGTLRLSILHRRPTLLTMRVIGATYGFIRGPYLVAGAVTVTAASVISLVIMRVAVSLGQGFLPGVRFIPGEWVFSLVLGSVTLGVAASYVALEPMLRRVESPKSGRVAVAAVLAVVALASSVGVLAQSESDYQKELNRLKQEIRENRGRIEKLQGEQTSLQEILDRLKRDADLTRSYLSKLDEQEARIEDDLAQREEDLAAARNRYENLRVRLHERLVDYYKSRRVDLAELLLSSRNFAELFARAHYMSWSIHRDKEDLRAVAQQEQEILAKTQSLHNRRSELRNLRAEKSKESQKLDARLKDTKGEKRKIERELDEHRKRLTDLEEREARVTTLLQNLKGRAFAGGGLEGQKGRLPWPVRGSIATGFGSQVHPRFKTRILSRGIDIAAPLGTEYRAVAAGLVAFAGYYAGYGNLVILDHGEGYFTLYGHSKSVLVEKGKTVAQGDVIGLVGETDSVKGAGLHFEVRKNAEALNPLSWLRKR